MPVSTRKVSEAQKKKIISVFLNTQLAWVERQCMEFSPLAATGDKWSIGQFQYFKKYRANLRHLISLNDSRKRELAEIEIKPMPEN